jgi:peptide/nickel transport system ATP-binding protein
VTEPSVSWPSGSEPRSEPGAPVLDVQGLTVAFGSGDARAGRGRLPTASREVVHGVSFALHPGSVLALVGESGSGKSVTAMALMSLLPPNAKVGGSARLDGEELVGAGPDRLRAVRGQQLAAIFQEPMSALNPVFRIGRQIAEALRVHQPGLDRTAADARVLDLLASVEVSDPRRIARSFPHEVSGGQLQRAMIAMAIGNDPAVLIADEPTTALDVTVQAGILALLRGLTERLGTAVLLITHDMGVVADAADDVAVMRQGVIVEQAESRQLFGAPQDPYTQALLRAVPTITGFGGSSRAEPDPGTPAAELTDVSVVFGGPHGTRAVDQVSLRVDRGEVVGLVGESGSGKSTMGRVLAGLVPVTSGQARLAGIDLAHASRRTLRQARRELGIVFQDPASSLNPRQPIGVSIAEPLVLHGVDDAAERRRRVSELLERVRLDASLATRLPHELSGGQRQRVALARALVDRPALLIADEPTSALDVSVQATVLDLLAELQGDLGFGCLFISHDLAVIATVADRVAVLYQGRLVESGPTRDVLTAPGNDYTRRLLAAVPVADPVVQQERRERARRAGSGLEDLSA